MSGLGEIFLNFVLCHACGGNAADAEHMGGCPQMTNEQRDAELSKRYGYLFRDRPFAHDPDSVL